jgi:uncharacterized membrane protein HdeD (DUF308 family)
MISEFTSEAEFKKSIGWLIAFSVALILMGILAILAPAIASAFFTSTMGWIALISGIVMVVQSFRSKPVKGFWLNLIIGIAYAIAGLYILTNVGKAMLVLTLAFGILFIVEGIFTIVMGFTNRSGRSMSWLVVLNGIITLILGILVLNSWPLSALWLIGLYVGISLLLSGISLLAAALAVKKELPA